jgi:ketosteroid isomerase-like protein
MADALILLVEAMDRCWIDRRFDDLSAFLAPDIVVVSPDGGTRLQGLPAAVESYRSFMARAKIAWFASRDHVVTERGDAAIVEYRWDMAWRSEGGAHEASGREILVLSRRDGSWLIVWRAQLPA